MISKEEFINFVKLYETFENGVNRLNGYLCSNLWECEWIDAVGKMWDDFMCSHFTDVGVDLINWWKYEDVDHIITQIVDPDLFHGESDIEYNVNDIEDLWNFLLTDKKLYFKNV